MRGRGGGFWGWTICTFYTGALCRRAGPRLGFGEFTEGSSVDAVERAPGQHAQHMPLHFAHTVVFPTSQDNLARTFAVEGGGNGEGMRGSEKFVVVVVDVVVVQGRRHWP